MNIPGWKLAGAAGLVCVLVGGWSMVRHYKTAYNAAQLEKGRLTSELNNAYAALRTQQELQDKLRELDTRYTGELADAKATIESLERDVLAGKRRVQLNAKCPVSHTSSTPPGVADGTGPRLNDAAQRDYFTLRERIETATVQIAGLQEYIKTQCQQGAR